jgi:NAD(P)-dependent dehydrogenase (short-subunit alcohol dehydrogenase family)
MNFQHKTVIVTGGAQGIGKAVTQAFALAGAFVVIADIDAEAGEELAEILCDRGLNARFIAADVGDTVQVKALVDQVTQVGGAVNVLINNAGISWKGSFAERSVDDWDRVLAVNIRGPYLCAQHAAPHMPRGSAIVNIASTRALMSETDTEPYSASKGGVVALTHSLAITLGPKGIRVNCISPGWIDVSGWKKESARNPLTLTERDHAQHPAGRVGRPEDIAQACLFLADTDKAGFITGQNLVVDGGMTIKMIYED